MIGKRNLTTGAAQSNLVKAATARSGCGTPPLKTCPAAIGSSTVKILNYNLFWWNLFERRHGENGRAGRKIASTSQPEEYDFMGFQECKDVNRVMSDAKRHGLSGDYG